MQSGTGSIQHTRLANYVNQKMKIKQENQEKRKKLEKNINRAAYCGPSKGLLDWEQKVFIDQHA